MGRPQRFEEGPPNVRCFKCSCRYEPDELARCLGSSACEDARDRRAVEPAESMPRGSGRQETGSNASPDGSLFAQRAGPLQRFNLPVDPATVSPHNLHHPPCSTRPFVPASPLSDDRRVEVISPFSVSCSFPTFRGSRHCQGASLDGHSTRMPSRDSIGRLPLVGWKMISMKSMRYVPSSNCRRVI